MFRPKLEVADVFRRWGDKYRDQYGAAMPRAQWRTMRAIEACRTAALGGHVQQCDECAYRAISYNSCRNRHCPKCQNLERARWLEARRDEMLPVDYFHVVFTLPSQIASIAYQNQTALYNLLFQTASKTLLTLARDPRHLGAEIGFVMILHTWGQNLQYHPHVHCMVTGGGLSPDSKQWIASKKKYLIPVRAASRLFRRLFLEGLETAFSTGRLEFHGSLSPLTHKVDFHKLLQSCREKEWVVYAKPPFGSPETVLDYLGRYTHRIAISNDRILTMTANSVTFSLKNYRKGGAREKQTLSGNEFIRRFLLHVVPERFVRIRHYGLLANCHRTAKIKLCRALLILEQQRGVCEQPPQDWTDLYEHLAETQTELCPSCKQGCMQRVETLPPVRPIPRSTSQVPVADST